MRLEELVKSTATGGGDLEMYLPSGQTIALLQPPIKAKTKKIKKQIKDLVKADEEDKKKKKKKNN